MAFYFAKIWLTDSAAKLVLIAAVSVAKISAANSRTDSPDPPERQKECLSPVRGRKHGS